MKCPNVDELSYYMDDVTTGVELLEIRQHIKSCPKCEQIVEALMEEHQLIKETLETPTLPEDFAQIVLNQLEPYEKKVQPSKYSFWNRMKQFKNNEGNGVPQMKRKKKHMLIAAASLFIALPATAVGAAKVYDLVVKKEGYEVNVSVENNAQENTEDWYKLQLGYLPENMEALNNDDMKYSFKDNYAQGGFSFNLWRLEENVDIKTLYSTNYEEVEINENHAVVIHRDTGINNAFDRKVLLFFEEKGIMLESFVGEDVSSEQMMDVLENISLEATSEDLASTIGDYDGNEETEEKIVPLEKDSKRIFTIGQTIPVKLNGVNNQINELEYVVKNVEVYDSLESFNLEDFNDYGLEVLGKYMDVTQSKKLQAYERDVYQLGDGKNSIDELVESKKVNVKFVHLTTTIKNISSHKTEEVYVSPSLHVLKSEGNTWNYADYGKYERSVMTGEVDYLMPHGEGKSYYNIGEIDPEETVEVQLGYFVDEDKLDSIFLNAFNYSWEEDMNAEIFSWVDLRQ